jgi:methyl-accepting chemotaxis protein
MKWFYDRKISTKLYLAFSSVVLILGIMAWLVYSSASRRAAVAEDMYSNRTASIMQLENVRAAFLDMRMARRTAVSLSDVGQRQEDLRKAAEYETLLHDGLKQYLAGTRAPSEREIIRHLQSGLDEYHRLQAESDVYMLQMNDRKVLDIFNGPVRPLAAAVTADLNKLIEINDTLARDGDQQDYSLRASTTRDILLVGALGLLFTIGLVMFLSRLIGGSLRTLQEAAEKLSAGDLEVQLDLNFADEVGNLARSFQAMADNLKQHAAAAEQVAQGNLEVVVHSRSGKDSLGASLKLCVGHIRTLVEQVGQLTAAARNGDLALRGDPGQFKGAYSELMSAVNDMFEVFRATMEKVGDMSEPLTQAAAELSRVAQEMGASAEQTASQANMVSAGAEQVSRNIHTVATASDEMGASIREIAKNTADASKVATAAVRSAEETNATISKLGQSSVEIGQVIKVITSIAQQTNLLALNATIEAARAGEAGKGFAVVANEVRELAKETAKATEDISRKIEAIQTDTKGAVAAIEQIASVIGQINDIQTTVASAVEEQSVTTNEITRNLTEAAKGGADISLSIAGVAEAARTTTAGAGQTQKSAESLEKLAADMQTLMARFRYNAGRPQVKPVIASHTRSMHRELAGASVQ